MSPGGPSAPGIASDEIMASTNRDVDNADTEDHVCITSHSTTVRERVGSMIFDFPAGSFFQNNNSVLQSLTEYVRDAIFAPHSTSAADSTTSSPQSTAPTRKLPTHLVDTYCGSGLFAITLSPYFSHIAGIEIDANAIKYAKHNLSLNKLDAAFPHKHTFHAGKSEDIFASVLKNSKEPFPPEDTVVVIDPPRKGCDESFIDQVVK
jgi:tRNA (uracil-5-)-methyltransferase